MEIGFRSFLVIFAILILFLPSLVKRIKVARYYSYFYVASVFYYMAFFSLATMSVIRIEWPLFFSIVAISALFRFLEMHYDGQFTADEQVFTYFLGSIAALLYAYHLSWCGFTIGGIILLFVSCAFIYYMYKVDYCYFLFHSLFSKGATEKQKEKFSIIYNLVEKNGKLGKISTEKKLKLDSLDSKNDLDAYIFKNLSLYDIKNNKIRDKYKRQMLYAWGVLFFVVIVMIVIGGINLSVYPADKPNLPSKITVKSLKGYSFPTLCDVAKSKKINKDVLQTLLNHKDWQIRATALLNAKIKEYPEFIKERFKDTNLLIKEVAKDMLQKIKQNNIKNKGYLVSIKRELTFVELLKKLNKLNSIDRQKEYAKIKNGEYLKKLAKIEIKPECLLAIYLNPNNLSSTLIFLHEKKNIPVSYIDKLFKLPDLKVYEKYRDKLKFSEWYEKVFLVKTYYSHKEMRLDQVWKLLEFFVKRINIEKNKTTPDPYILLKSYSSIFLLLKNDFKYKFYNINYGKIIPLDEISYCLILKYILNNWPTRQILIEKDKISKEIKNQTKNILFSIGNKLEEKKLIKEWELNEKIIFLLNHEIWQRIN